MTLQELKDRLERLYLIDADGVTDEAAEGIITATAPFNDRWRLEMTELRSVAEAKKPLSVEITLMWAETPERAPGSTKHKACAALACALKATTSITSNRSSTPTGHACFRLFPDRADRRAAITEIELAAKSLVPEYGLIIPSDFPGLELATPFGQDDCYMRFGMTEEQTRSSGLTPEELAGAGFSLRGSIPVQRGGALHFQIHTLYWRNLHPTAAWTELFSVLSRLV